MAKSARKSTRKHPLANAPVINPMQLGGIETSVLDNGPGRGVRIAWVNTGGGLRYKVVIDRGLDIADAEFMNQSLTWHSLAGTVAPSFAYTRKMDWIRGFCGGMMASCGPITFAPGDSQYVLVKLAVGHGPDRLSSLTELRYNLNFTGPTELTTVIRPNPQYLVYRYALTPIMDTIFISRQGSDPVGDVDHEGLVINGTLTPSSISYPSRL